ncbi:MAG: hypothetical protein ACREHV_15670, partial [Rhizomicrobium sp.]
HLTTLFLAIEVVALLILTFCAFLHPWHDAVGAIVHPSVVAGGHTVPLICWALTYIAMFSIPLIAKGETAPSSVRIAAASGLIMTVRYAVLSIFPVVEVKNAAAFTAKVGGVVLAINVAGALYFRRVRTLAAIVVLCSQIAQS